jgi:hypothetical protein
MKMASHLWPLPEGTEPFPSVLNVATPFKSQAVINLASLDDLTAPELATGRFRVTLSGDRNAMSLAVVSDGEPPNSVSVMAGELDYLIARLGEARWMLRDQVPHNFADMIRTGAVTREFMVINPTWRTELPMHPSLGGITLRLRHPGFGWLTFLLPWHEARRLGDWLTKNSPPSGSAG